MKPAEPDSLNAGLQKRLEEVLVDVDATLAALRAGFSRKMAASVGRRYAGNAAMQANILRRELALLQPTPHTRRQVMEGLQDAFDLTSIKGDDATMLSAANAMAALVGLVGLAQLSRENGDPGASNPFAEMTDAELLEIMEGSQGR